MTTNIPISQAPGALPLLGHLLPLVRDPLKFLTSLPARGDLVHIRIGPMKALLVCDPGLTRHVLVNDRTFDKGGPAFDQGREVLGNGLPLCPHTDHRRQRRLVQPAFHPARLPAYARLMTEQTDTATGSWTDGQTIDAYTEMQNIVAQGLVATMFADTLNPTAITGVLEDLGAITDGIFRRMITPPRLNTLPTPGNRRYYQARSRLRQTMARATADRRSAATGHDDLLSVLLGSPDSPEDGHDQNLSDAEVIDQLMAFFFAGIETAAATLAWALHALAQHPHIEEQLHAEADSVLAGAAATLDDVPRLEYTRRVLMESLRCYPPAWLVSRTTTTDTHLGTHPVRAGTAVFFSPYLIHHRTDQYDNPEQFDPDRWSSSRHLNPPDGSFIPFGGGARKCVGDQFGITEAVIILATIAARWRLEPLPGRPVRPALALTLSPQRLHMRLRPRT
ncbi:cytochrome P450 [Streptomyces sp. NPDC052164]|uniref:cytochrome P450 n=1 Tax=Streptomyces sp. NPDC052164 TaxID=3155529 RepID=UPI00341DBCE3